VGLGQEGVYDSDIYEGTAGISRFEGYLDSIPATDDQEVSCLCCLFVSFKSFALVSCCHHFHMCIPVSARKFFLHIFVTKFYAVKYLKVEKWIRKYGRVNSVSVAFFVCHFYHAVA